MVKSSAEMQTIAQVPPGFRNQCQGHSHDQKHECHPIEAIKTKDYNPINWG
jgi:hypothetical protein